MPDLTLAQAPDFLSVSLDWKTYVERCSEVEYRQGLRDIPRATITWKIDYAGQEQLPLLDATLNTGSVVRIADWRYAQRFTPSPDLQTHTATALTWYAEVGDTVCLLYADDTHETRVITSHVGDAVTLDAPATAPDAWILQTLELTLIAAPSFALVGANTVTASLQGVANGYPDLSAKHQGYNTLDGLYRREQRDLRDGGPAARVDSGNVLFSTEAGPISITNRYLPREERFISGKADTPASVMQVEAMFHFLSGRLNPFWQSSWREDFRVAAPAATGANLVIVDKTLSAEAIPGGVHVLNTGAHHRIVSVADGGATLTLTLATNLAAPLVAGEYLSRLDTHRLGSDNVRLEFSRGFNVQYTLATVEVPYVV